MSQPRPTQHQDFNEMQMWQQHLMYKQLQELQRQQQLQQLDEGARPHHSLSQLSAAAGKPAAVDQLPVMLNEMPSNTAANYMWSSNFVGGDSKPPGNSQMAIAGKMNWAQSSSSPSVHNFTNGVMFTNSQGQAIRSTGFMPQQLDQSLYGMPVSSTRGSGNQYSQFPGISNDCSDVVTKAGGNQVEKTSMPSGPFNTFQSNQHFPEQGFLQDGVSIPMQNFQGNGLSGSAGVQSLNSDVTSGNFRQLNNLQNSIQIQEFHGRQQEQAVWSGNLQEKPAAQAGSSHSVASLDPTEEKILFGTDDDNWGASFENANHLQGNPSGNELFGGFPSLQSGSWSALMQEAVQASTSDVGMQEEWSGLSFPITGPSGLNPSSITNDNGKQQAAWNDGNLQNVSSLTSRPLPLFTDANVNPNCRTAPGSQHSFKPMYEKNAPIPAEASLGSYQQSSKEASNKQFQSHGLKQLMEGGLQGQTHVTNGTWVRHTYEQHENNSHSSNMEYKLQNMHGGWTPEHNVPFPGVTSQPSNKINGWNINSLAPTGDATSTFHDNDGSSWRFGGNHVNPSSALGSANSDIGNSQVRTEDSLTGSFPAVMKSSSFKVNQGTNQQVINRHQAELRKYVSLTNSNGDQTVERNQNQQSGDGQGWESSISNLEKGSGETHDHKQQHTNLVSNESYISSHSSIEQHTNSGRLARENTLLPGTGSQRSSSQYGQQNMGSHMFQNHAVGSLGLNVETSFSPNSASHSQGSFYSISQGKTQGQKHLGHSQFPAHLVSNNVVGSAKGDFTNLQRIAIGAEELQSKGSIPSHPSTGSSFDGLAAQYSQNKRNVQTSQNMLELLHKVDQSRDSTTVSSSDMPQPTSLNLSFSCSQPNQPPSLQGFGLRLAPPSSQRQTASNYALPSQTSLHDLNGRQLDKMAGERDRTWSTTMAPVRPLSPPQETSQRENWDNKSSPQTSKETSRSHPTVKSASISGNGPEQQQQGFSSASGHVTTDQPVRFSFGSHANVHALAKNASLLRQPNDSQERPTTDQSVQASLPGRVPPFSVASSSDAHAPASSQFYPIGPENSKLINSDFSHVRSSGQHFPVGETRSGSQPSTSGISQQVGLSTMLRNVWTNVPAQQRLAALRAHKLTPQMLQSLMLSSNSRDSSPWGLQKVDDQRHKGQSAPSELGAHSVNTQNREEHPGVGDSQNQMPSENVDNAAKTASSFQGREAVQKHPLDGNSAVSIPSLVRLHQQDASKGKHAQDSSIHSQAVRATPTNITTSGSDMGFYGRASKPLDIQQQNYSLLHQMQAMKGADSDPSKRAGKRLKIADVGSDAGQRIIYGQNSAIRVSVDSELGAASHSSFPSDVKILSFASRDNLERSASPSSLLSGREVSSQDIHTTGQHHLQNHFHSLSTGSASNLMGGIERPQISPQMAPSWFEQYGNYKNGQVLAMYDGQRSAKFLTQQQIFPKVSGNVDKFISVEQRIATTQAGSLGQSISLATATASESLPCSMPSDVKAHDIVLRSNKRKIETSELLPWHKVVTRGSRRLETISMAELDWAHAANRLTEKLEDESEITEDGPSMPQPRRRLILTTQLMQQLLPAVPAAILRAEATSAYESATYSVAKSVVGDACSLIACSGSESLIQLDNENMISGKPKTCEKVQHDFFSKVVEDFIGRSKKLENEFSRLDKKTSLLDVRLECQELERISIINRLGKFHGRSHTDSVESSSETASRKTFPQRLVTAHSMPGNLPEGVFCLSL